MRAQGRRSSGQGFGDAGRGRIDADVLPTVQRRRRRGGGRGHGAGPRGDRRQEGRRAREQRPGRADARVRYNTGTDLSTLTLVEGTAPRAPDQIVIDKNSADDAGYKLGDTVPVITKDGRADYELTGIVKFGTSNSLLGATIVAFTPATATRVLGEPGSSTTIDVKADSGRVAGRGGRATSAPRSGRARHREARGDQRREDHHRRARTTSKKNLSFFNTFLLVFGVVALLVGSFIIFNTFSIIVAQRGRELALLRAIGAVSAR